MTNDQLSKCSFAFGLGVVTGAAVLYVSARKSMNSIIEFSDAAASKQRALFTYTMDKLAPYAPEDALVDIKVYMDTELISLDEEGLIPSDKKKS